MLLHTSHPVNWSAWHLEPTVAGAAAIVLGIYLLAMRDVSPTIRWRKASLFLLGWSIMLLSLISPLDAGADRLLSLHMIQHVALTTLGPPLVLLGLPATVASRLPKLPFFAAMSLPLITGPLFLVNMWLWHAPPLYDAALRDLPVHVTMHAAFMATGLLYWWPVIHSMAGRAGLGEGGKLLYLFVSGFPMGILALLLLASGNVIYSHYETSDPLWGIAPLDDQQIAGMIMGSLGEAASFVAMSLLFLRFLDKDAAEEPASVILNEVKNPPLR